MKKITFLIFIIIIACQGENPKDKGLTTTKTDSIISIEKDNELKKVEFEKTEKLKVIVLPPYDRIANRGISPHIREYLQNELKKSDEISLIDFPFKKLMNVPYQKVFDRKYCQPIIENIDCDIIVMSKLDFVKQTGNMPRDGWNLRIRLFNVNTNIQIDSKLEVDSLSGPGIKKMLGLTQEIIIEEMKSTVANSK